MSSAEHVGRTPCDKSSTDVSLDHHPSHQSAESSPTSNARATSKQYALDLTRTKSIAETLSPLHEFLFVGLLCSAQFVTQAGLLNTLNILHVIGSDLGITNPGVLSWLVAGYSLTVGTFILLSGRCGDLFGYKPMLIIGFTWFAIWNVVAGCSVYVSGNGSQVLFIFARVLSGIGPAILLPNALGLLGATYNQGPKKDMIFSLFGACAPGESLFPNCFALTTDVCRGCCRWRNLCWPLVVTLVALDFLDFWNYACRPCGPVHLHSSISTTGSRSAESHTQEESCRARHGWCVNRYYCHGALQLCMEPGSRLWLEQSLHLCHVDYRSLTFSGLLLV
jgi:hypothetical protein